MAAYVPSILQPLIHIILDPDPIRIRIRIHSTDLMNWVLWCAGGEMAAYSPSSTSSWIRIEFGYGSGSAGLI